MIVYHATKKVFMDDIFHNAIETKIHDAYFMHLGRRTSPNEVASWRNSMHFMNNILMRSSVPDDTGISIEFQIPLTAKRIDFIMTGLDKSRHEKVVIVELKQWEKAELTSKDAIVRTRFQSGERETAHPSYQAWSYAQIMANLSETVEKENIELIPCAYLHNYAPDNVITNPFYRDYLSKAPVFLREDAVKLKEFIENYIHYGDDRDILYKIDRGRIRPSKQLADSLQSMLAGNQEFVMLDEQKVVYETAVSMALKAKPDRKQVLIVEGGPGTGKSVVAVNLLVELTNRGLLSKYVSKNAAPRAVYMQKLKGTQKKSFLDNIFGGSGSFIDTEPNLFDALIVDEAHRLNRKSGLYQNMGENQVKEIISASKFTIFFVDDYQRIHVSDVGLKAELEKCAKEQNAIVNVLKLESQFRCNGAEGYLSWLDNVLQIRSTANIKLSRSDFDFRVFTNPKELLDEIKQKNSNNKSRMVAGYCWDWKSKRDVDKNAYDIEFPEYNFHMQWNLKDDGSIWILGKDSVNQIGCIHTCQGLELDYVGVIVGPDISFVDGKIVTDFLKRSLSDNSIKGLKTQMKTNPIEVTRTAEEIIKNTYRTLMTRGMKGCYVYFCDEELGKYFQSMINDADESLGDESKDVIEPDIRIEPDVNDDVKFIDYLPLYSLKAACGVFGDEELVEPQGWVKVSHVGTLKKSMFVVKATGHSMEPKIMDGDYCVFKGNVVGSRNNKIVLVQHAEYYDAESQGSYSIKKYTSEKKFDQMTGEWEHEKIVLKPLNPDYDQIVIEEEDGYMVIGEFVEIVK